MLQQLLPLPGFVPVGPANDLAPDPFEGMMPNFLEIPLRVYLAEHNRPKPFVEAIAIALAEISDPPPRIANVSNRPAWLQRQRENAKAQRKQRQKNMRRRRH